MATLKVIRDFLSTLPKGAEFSARDLRQLVNTSDEHGACRKALAVLRKKGEIEVLREEETHRGGHPLKVYRVVRLADSASSALYCEVREWLYTMKPGRPFTIHSAPKHMDRVHVSARLIKLADRGEIKRIERAQGGPHKRSINWYVVANLRPQTGEPYKTFSRRELEKEKAALRPQLGQWGGLLV